MGLDTSHNAWHGSYSGFSNFRKAVCKAANMGELDEYIGFGGTKPFPHWIDIPVVPLLDHSDCDGYLGDKSNTVRNEAILLGVADYLDMLCDEGRLFDPEGKEGWYYRAARQFAKGCRDAADAGEVVEFG